MKTSATSRDRGFTLLEMMFALLILAVVIIPIGYVFLQMSGAFSSLARRTHTATQAPVVMDRLVGELMNGQFSSLLPPNPDGDNAVEFRKIVDFDGENPVFGNPVHIDLEPQESSIDNGADDDGDGLVDESAIRIWEDLPPVSPGGPGPEDDVSIVGLNVAKDGLKFKRTGAFLSVSVTYDVIVERGKPAVPFHIQSGVMIRND